MKKLKRNIHLLIFLILVLLLPVILFLTAGQDGALLPVCDNLESNIEETEPVNINYYALTYIEGSKKELSLPETKSQLDVEPEKEESVSNADAKVPEKVAEEKSPEVSSQPGAASGSASSSLGQKEQQMVNLINEARANAGLSPLTVNSQLVSAARAKSKDMVNNNYFSHHSPTYGDLSGLLRRFGITYRAAGENLAMNSNGSVNAAHNSLMGSSGHRANILNNRYKQVGVGIHTKSDGSHYYTQLFIGF